MKLEVRVVGRPSGKDAPSAAWLGGLGRTRWVRQLKLEVSNSLASAYLLEPSSLYEDIDNFVAYEASQRYENIISLQWRVAGIGAQWRHAFSPFRPHEP